MSKQKSPYSRSFSNPIEKASASGDYGGEKPKTVKQSVKDQFDGIEDDFLAQLLGYDYKDPSTKMQMAPEKPKTNMEVKGDMQPGESIDLASFSFKAEIQAQAPSYADQSSYREELGKRERKPDILAGIDYRNEIVHGSERISRKDATELQQKIQQIIDELSKLISASVMLQAEFTVSVEQAPANVGKYHINFFEWLLIWVKNVRTKTEDAGAWLNVMSSKKSQRKYGKMAKKMGTKFTLANERTPATQTG
jgi:hypothetical protein